MVHTNLLIIAAFLPQAQSQTLNFERSQLAALMRKHESQQSVYLARQHSVRSGFSR